jgi:hypothetical protein
MRGLLLVALSGLFAATAALAAPALTAPAGIKPAGTPNAEIATLSTQNVEFKWSRGGLSDAQLKDYRVFVGSLVGSFEIAQSAVIQDGGDGNYSTTLVVPANGGKRVFVRLSYTEVVSGIEVIKNVDYVINAAVSPLVDGDAHYVYTPVPGSTLDLQDVDGCKASPMVAFDWAVAAAAVTADGGNPDQWWFYLGNAGNSRAFFNSGKLTAEQRTVTIANIPTDGDSLVATLWWKRGDAAWRSSTFSYGTPSLPAITSPTPGASLSGTSGNLGLNANGLPVRYWWVYAGPERQSVAYLSDGQEVDPLNPSVTLAPFQNFPDDGSNVYVTLFWRLQGDTAQQWKCREYVYKASSGPAITAPAADVVLPTGSVTDPLLASNTETVTWDPKGTVASGFEVVLNHSGDPSDNGVWRSGILSGSTTSAEIPKARFTTNGETIYIVLRYAVNGGLAQEVFDGSVVAAYATRKAPYITSPGGATLAKCTAAGLGNEATFEWTDGNLADVKGYWAYVGKSQGTSEYANTGSVALTTTSVSVNNLPTDGSEVWVRLWYLVDTTTASITGTPNVDETLTTNVYNSRDFLFSNPKSPEITSPGFGATINGIERAVTIDAHFVPGAQQLARSFWVTVSSAAPAGGDPKNPDPGEANIDSSGSLAADATTFNIRNLPVDGSAVYTTLWWLPVSDPGTNVGWNYRTYRYVSSNAAPPQLTAPDPTTVFDTNAAVTFTWKPNETVVTGWWLYVGDGVGKNDRHNSGFIQSEVLSDATVAGLPFGNSYVRLWFLDQFGLWQFIDYVLDNQAGATGPDAPTFPVGPEGENDTDGDNSNGI